MKVAITDANIFIDLYEIDLLKEFFKLPYEIHTTEFVLDEIGDCESIVLKHATILRVAISDEKNMIEMQMSRWFSDTDKTILYMAKQHSMMVLSG